MSLTLQQEGLLGLQVQGDAYDLKQDLLDNPGAVSIISEREALETACANNGRVFPVWSAPDLRLHEAVGVRAGYDVRVVDETLDNGSLAVGVFVEGDPYDLDIFEDGIQFARQIYDGYAGEGTPPQLAVRAAMAELEVEYLKSELESATQQPQVEYPQPEQRELGQGVVPLAALGSGNESETTARTDLVESFAQAVERNTPPDGTVPTIDHITEQPAIGPDSTETTVGSSPEHPEFYLGEPATDRTLVRFLGKVPLLGRLSFLQRDK